VGLFGSLAADYSVGQSSRRAIFLILASVVVFHLLPGLKQTAVYFAALLSDICRPGYLMTLLGGHMTPLVVEGVLVFFALKRFTT
jgi:hypothetical protein